MRKLFLAAVAALSFSSTAAAQPKPGEHAISMTQRGAPTGFYCKMNRETTRFDLYHASRFDKAVATNIIGRDRCLARVKGSFFCKRNPENSDRFDLYHVSDLTRPIDTGFVGVDHCLVGVTG